MADYYLVHHGIKGQKWGVRRYQNEDGSLTAEGRKRYYYNDDNDGLDMRDAKQFRSGDSRRSIKKSLNKMDQAYAEEYGRKSRMDKRGNALANKAEKALSKGKEDKAKKLSDESADAFSRGLKSQKRMAAIESNQWKTIAKAAERGFNVYTTQIPRTTASKGKIYTAAFLAGPVASAIVVGASKKVTGNKFNVY